MTTVVIAKFGGLNKEERREIKSHAIDIYKFFKFLNYSRFFDLVALKKNIFGFAKVVNLLGSFLPFVERNYDTIINFDKESSEEFLSEIGDLILEEKKLKGKVSITAEDIERYSNLSEICSEVIEQKIFFPVTPHDYFEFLKDRGLFASFYREYCC